MFESFFEPSSVAIVGASRTPGKVGHDTLKNLIDAGFPGPIYPINPKAEDVLERRCYPDLKSVGKPIELVAIAIPARFVPDVIDECAEVNCRSVVVMSAGFKESGPEGEKLEEELKARCTRHGIRCIGPNCLGVISPPSHLNVSFGATMPPADNVGFFSQSGAIGTTVLDLFAGEGAGISRFVSYGNKSDVDESDLIEALAQDDKTEVIMGYVESIDDGAKFMEVARRATAKKPVVILKSGRTGAGARAAASHTGSLAGSDSAYDAAFKQCGVIRAATITEFFDMAFAFSSQKPPKGNAVAIVTNAGGPSVIATDTVDASALTMAKFSEATESRLTSGLPPAASIHNPIDLLGDAKADRYRLALDAVVDDENVDAILTIITPQTTTEVEGTAEVIGDVADRTDKPLLASFMGSRIAQKGWDVLEKRDVPNYVHPERAIKTLSAMYRFRTWREANRTGQAPPPPRFKFDEGTIKNVLEHAMNTGMKALGEQQARGIIEACGLPVPASVLAATQDEAVKAAEQTGYPVVMKISSDDILHKSDAGGVRLGLKNEDQVKTAFERIIAAAKAFKADADIDGVLVQQMIEEGTEVIVGMSRDPQFGPVIMFGLGGIYVELLRDVSFRVAPLGEAEAREMIEEIRAAGILTGARGQEAEDVDAVVDCILRVSQLATDYPSITECDLNPLVVFGEGKGAMALDTRFAIA